MSNKRNELNAKSKRNKMRRQLRETTKMNTTIFRKEVVKYINKLELEGMEALRNYAMEIGIPYGRVYGNPPPSVMKLKKRIIAQRMIRYKD